ncbi:hypothetical protein NLI96_g6406 [Meripilus lineatus]|uniref:SHSP domain-containing protein n=1 Tax=Meripilus lineatus TaxID=2056292 RepID=A0AAD5V141_9APHY|nr:hypothetical protein NLI96_g6406 [Physisporinus lineatus]
MRAMELGLPSSPKPPRVQFKSQIGRTPMLLPRRFQLSISHGTVTRTLIIPSLTGRAIYHLPYSPVQMDAFNSTPSKTFNSNVIFPTSSPRIRAKSPELSISTSLSESSPSSRAPSPYPPVPESPTARSRRAPLPSRTPTMKLTSTMVEHTFDVWLPKELLSEMVTVSAKRGNRVDVVADIWHQEKDSHYEWEIAFPPHDVDMSSIRVDLAHGHLTIRARRLQRRSSTV